MPGFEYYRTYLQAGLGEAEQYLLSEDLYWSVSVIPSAEASYPNLTLGSLLLFQKSARVLAKRGSEQAAFQKLETQFEALRSRWRVAWGRKATQEFEARLRQWGNALREIRDQPGENAAYFRYEVRSRVLLELLEKEAGDVDPASLEHLTSLDLILQALFEPGGFIWEQNLAPAFPKPPFWYLWGQPRKI